jgi:folate-binding protein YgfZ
MVVLVGDDEVLLLVERAATEKLAAVFDKLIIMEDVHVTNASENYVVLGLLGPETKNVLAHWTGRPFQDKPLYSHEAVEQGSVCSTDLGYDVIVARETADQALRSITASGAVQIDRETWNIFRTEAGLPLFGVDIDETTTLPELGQRGISYDKGCYIGQEVVARIKYIGHVNRRFTGFICEGTTVPEPHTKVQNLQGKEVGYVTTGVFSPRLSKPIALGFVNRAAAEPGTPVVLAEQAGQVGAEVSSLPFR